MEEHLAYASTKTHGLPLVFQNSATDSPRIKIPDFLHTDNDLWKP